MTTRWKLGYVMKGYDWTPIVYAYMASKEVKPMDEVIRMSPKVDKAAPAIYGQLIAEAWGMCD